jgi:hypothetical protein
MSNTKASFYVAMRKREDVHGIYGIGRTPEAALDEAWENLNEGTERPKDFGFEARPATERLYVFVERHSPDAKFQPVTNIDCLQDLDIDSDVLARIVAEVATGFDGSTAQDSWTAEEALTDAHDYIDAYVVNDEGVDEELRDALDNPAMRVAADLAVRDLILETIAEIAA